MKISYVLRYKMKHKRFYLNSFAAQALAQRRCKDTNFSGCGENIFRQSVFYLYFCKLKIQQKYLPMLTQEKYNQLIKLPEREQNAELMKMSVADRTAFATWGHSYYTEEEFWRMVYKKFDLEYEELDTTAEDAPIKNANYAYSA